MTISAGRNGRRDCPRPRLCAQPIYSHLLAAIECGKLVERDRFFTPAQENEIAAAFRQIADGTLVDVSALLGNKYDIGELRIFRVFATRSRVQRRR